ncbi:hypothetical protein L226DRAFT_546761 [Lentinus tigrinus ALCF2SS1-7]|uniref:uncharacterized protein n=1 Tax=Lentinus tigrinus ALCF2SS1-7 TaxID=1328758 RepID=UPI001165D5B1|nr:hypothetical protein L226DRAFT_546761 [Lentinus tigrinus ALCF2SS1-7]
MATIVCDGCKKPFLVTRFRSHLDRTIDSRADDEDTEPEVAQDFAGDYFGEYDGNCFDDYDEYNGPPEGEDGDDEDYGAEGEAGAEGDGEDGSSSDEDEVEDDFLLAEEAERHAEEGDWEPAPRADIPSQHERNTTEIEEEIHGDDAVREAYKRTHTHLHAKTFTVPFPSVQAGAPIDDDHEDTEYERFQSALGGDHKDNPYAPFLSRIDWEIARWAKMRGPGSTAVSELLQIKDIVTLLGLSYKNTNELNKIIDEQLTSARPRFIRREIIVAGEAFEVFYRDVIQCIRALYGDPEFSGILVFTPERHYTDKECKTRVYFDMHTGRWWWDTQKALEKIKPGATLIPIIISSDKTQLTVFGSRTAYPVYLTIGNLPKDVRRKPSHRGQILLAYLPSSRLEHITNKAARRRVLANVFHKCLSTILKPLVQAGIQGIKIASGDGVVRRGHPIFAMYIGDYPEQLLVTCCKTGTCPKCDIPRNDVGKSTEDRRPLRDLKRILHAVTQVGGSSAAFSRACREAGIKPVRHPFWVQLPFVNIFRSITPDILHQLYQGIIKHLIAWLTEAYGAEELDARCRRLPPNQHVRLFMKGITTLQRVTGKEHSDICKFLLALIVGLPLRDGMSPVRLVRAVHALLDFLYLAQYPAHTSDTLRELRAALERFHQHKSVFVDLGIRTNWKIPKLHSLDHYGDSIKLFGTTDNCDTQYTERLHIDFAKDAYRATNCKDELPQMTVWLERREKILRHDAFIKWRLEQIATREDAQLHMVHQPLAIGPASGLLLAPRPLQSLLPSRALSTHTRIHLTKHPSIKGVRFNRIASSYSAPWIRDALARFIVSYRDPLLTQPEIELESNKITYRWDKLWIWHKIKFVLDDAQELGIMESVQDVAHVRPARSDKYGRPVPGRFDTVLVNDGSGGMSGIAGYRLPPDACQQYFPDSVPPGHLAYIEWYTAFTQPDPVHGMYRISRSRDGNGCLRASVVEVRHIRRSCHLYPVSHGPIDRSWTSSTVLDKCEDFWVSPFSDMHMYMTLF